VRGWIAAACWISFAFVASGAHATPTPVSSFAGAIAEIHEWTSGAQLDSDDDQAEQATSLLPLAAGALAVYSAEASSSAEVRASWDRSASGHVAFDSSNRPSDGTYTSSSGSWRYQFDREPSDLELVLDFERDANTSLIVSLPGTSIEVPFEQLSGSLVFDLDSQLGAPLVIVSFVTGIFGAFGDTPDPVRKTASIEWRIVPEPATGVLTGLGVLALAFAARFRPR
jgi:hypothetical protein